MAETTYGLQFNTLLSQSLSGRLGSIASDTANLESFGESRIGEDVLDD